MIVIPCISWCYNVLNSCAQKLAEISLFSAVTVIAAPVKKSKSAEPKKNEEANGTEVRRKSKLGFGNLIEVN